MQALTLALYRCADASMGAVLSSMELLTKKGTWGIDVR